MTVRTSETIQLPFPMDVVVERVSSMQSRLPAFLLQGVWQQPDATVLVQFKTNVNLVSFGENVNITIAPTQDPGTCTVSVYCESALKTTLFDMGRTKKLTKGIIADLQAYR